MIFYSVYAVQCISRKELCISVGGVLFEAFDILGGVIHSGFALN